MFGRWGLGFWAGGTPLGAEAGGLAMGGSVGGPLRAVGLRAGWIRGGGWGFVRGDSAVGGSARGGPQWLACRWGLLRSGGRGGGPGQSRAGPGPASVAGPAIPPDFRRTSPWTSSGLPLDFPLDFLRQRVASLDGGRGPLGRVEPPGKGVAPWEESGPLELAGCSRASSCWRLPFSSPAITRRNPSAPWWRLFSRTFQRRALWSATTEVVTPHRPGLGLPVRK